MSPLRHYKGGIPPERADWACPACGAKQDGPLAAGCQACGAGSAKPKVQQAQPAQTQARPLSQAEPESLPRGDVPSGAAEAWKAWADAHREIHKVADWQFMEEAFLGGVAWAMKAQAFNTELGAAMERPSAQPAQAYLYLADDTGVRDESLDQPMLQTILAALAFYRDNTLNFGPVPGQLSAQQVTELIARLSPEEQIA